MRLVDFGSLQLDVCGSLCSPAATDQRFSMSTYFNMVIQVVVAWLLVPANPTKEQKRYRYDDDESDSPLNTRATRPQIATEH